jgi:hypothetical protein
MTHAEEKIVFGVAKSVVKLAMLNNDLKISEFDPKDIKEAARVLVDVEGEQILERLRWLIQFMVR